MTNAQADGIRQHASSLLKLGPENYYVYHEGVDLCNDEIGYAT